MSKACRRAQGRADRERAGSARRLAVWVFAAYARRVALGKVHCPTTTRGVREALRRRLEVGTRRPEFARAAPCTARRFPPQPLVRAPLIFETEDPI